MKKIFLALTIFTLLLPAARLAEADSEVSVDFFYNNLSGGNWIEVGDYGYGWQPDVAVSDSNWRPYSDGYWAYTDVGWTWVSYEDFGWATYHYGRWARLTDYGWVWFPGSDLDWGPAWVSWRTGGDYVGWAPLPPRGPGIVYEGRPIGGRVDIDFDIGPAYYNFVDVRYIGEPVLRSRIVAPSENVTYINNTVNVTNITYQNNVVYNYGPDYNVLSARSSRPIQRLRLEREANVDVTAAARSGGLTKVQGDKLVVGAPMTIKKPAAQIAPPNVKTKVAQPKLEKGWAGVSNEAEVKQKMKTEDLKKVPPPSAAGAPGQAPPAAPATAPTAPVAPTGAAAPTAAASPFERGKRTRPGQPPQPNVTASPRVAPAEGGLASPPPRPSGRQTKGKPGEQIAPTPPTGGPTVAPEGTPTPGGKNRGQFERGVRSPTPGEPGGVANEPPHGKQKGQPLERATPGQPGGVANEPPRGKQKGQPLERTTPGEPGGVSNEPPHGKQKGQSLERATPGQPGGVANEPPQRQQKGQLHETGIPGQPGGVPNEPPHGKQKGQPVEKAAPSPGGGQFPGDQGARQRGPGTNLQPSNAPAGGAERGQAKPAGGKKKGEASPSATPQ
ncbi:MAG: hypothetical protein DMF17_09505 [Verrucomicrobia bacterium]|nr:MAG: hypothetical protein DMF17_09505 [Verrucomicrobiota bacterium]